MSNYQWSVSGNTFQDWEATTPAMNGKPENLQSSYYASGPGVLTNSTAHWYWSDKAATQTVSCTATVTPPTGQGPPFIITATKAVILQEPQTNETDTPGITRLDNQYPAFPGIYSIWAGPTGALLFGSQWEDSVQTMPPFQPNTQYPGAWAHLQIITASGQATASVGNPKSLGSGKAGLDEQFPYVKSGRFSKDNGVKTKEGDSPGDGLDDAYTNFNPTDAFDLYVMYIPPGEDALPVPLTKLHWTWGANVTVPNTGHWSDWPSGKSPGGPPVVPAQGTRCIDEPQWDNIVTGAAH